MDWHAFCCAKKSDEERRGKPLESAKKRQDVFLNNFFKKNFCQFLRNLEPQISRKKKEKKFSVKTV
jgi:hypothetical protein